MRKEYGKVLRDAFIKNMRQKLPQFELTKYPSSNIYIVPGERIFRWIPKEPRHCFIILSPNPKGYDEFTVEIGWSKLGQFPELSLRPLGRPTRERNEFSKAEFTCRLPDFSPGLSEFWSISSFSISGFIDSEAAFRDSIKPISAEEAEKAVLPAVDDAINRLLSHGVPYLEEFVNTVI